MTLFSHVLACVARGEEGTFVFCMIRCLGDKTRATRDVEKSISMMETLPSSLLNIFEKGSV